MKIKNILFASLAMMSVSGHQITCPKLNCLEANSQSSSSDEKKMDTNICFEHDNKSPTEQMWAFSCQDHQRQTETLKGDVVCDFNVLDNQYAWVNEETQHLESSGTWATDEFLEQSQLYKKRTQGQCFQTLDMRKMQLGGRNCTQSTQCYSLNCDFGDQGTDEVGNCKGRLEDDSCFENADCDRGLFCQRSDVYPYLSKCKKLRTTYEPCGNTEECQLNLFCWYGNKQQVVTNEKKCLPMYSQFPEALFGWSRLNFNGEEKLEKEIQDDTSVGGLLETEGWPTYEDYQWNGQHCKSGMAYYDKFQESAMCADIANMTIMQGDNVLSDKFACNPRDNENPCTFYFNGTGENEADLKFTVPCRCALDGSQDGFCGSIIGTSDYQEALVLLKRMLEKSDCHSLDRGNYQAQADCNTEYDSVVEAIEAMFNMNHWPYVQNDEIATCLKTISSQSKESIVGLEQGMKLVATSLTALLTLVYI